LVDPQSFTPRPADRAGIGDLLLAFPRGLVATAPIVFFIFLIGGSFRVLNATGAIEAGIERLARSWSDRPTALVAILMLVFALAGGTMGMAEETIAFLPALVLLARRMGYDEVVGGAIGLVGAGAGFAGAFLNPFTVGVAQGIAGLPLFSGIAFRSVVWVTMTAAAIAYVVVYCRRFDRSPPSAAPAGATAPTVRQWVVLLLLVVALGLLVYGALRLGWGILELSGLFLALAIVAGALGGLGANRIAEEFVAGAAALTGGALVVGLARGIIVVLEDGRILDTVLNAMASGVAELPAWTAAAGLYFVQVVLNFLVPSGSGQAALSIPVLAPLGDLVGVTRQTTVLAYQLGDGISNVFTPTQGYFMAALAVAGISWADWVRFVWRLEVIWFLLGLALVLVAHAIDLGPF
ncbi:MAG: AbgT family transporter, partial [Thermoanaerobaculia bacterium]|nr:AbgT family transporter [Thermoanaerobaculia bacterium]